MNKKAMDIGNEFEAHTGRVMAKFRNIRGYTQDDMGIDLGISGRTYGKYEKASIPVKASTMAAVSQICDFDMIEYILFKDESAAQKFKGLIKGSRINPYKAYASNLGPISQRYDYINEISMEEPIHGKSVKNVNPRRIYYGIILIPVRCRYMRMTILNL